MSDISGVAGQMLQQILEKQGASQQIQPTAGGRSFESYMQQDQTLQSQGSNQNTTTEGIEKTQSSKEISGSSLQSKLEEMQAQLARNNEQMSKSQADFTKMMPELLDSKSRIGLLREAAASANANNPNMSKDFTGRLVQLESQYNEVEAIMRSDKNLSPGELLALQARLYQVSQHVEVMSKVVDQMAGGIKTVLNTNV